MKAQITPENKERFFALYISQPVLADNLRDRTPLDKSWNWRHKDFWLNLTPLSAITDEDAIEVAAIVFGKPEATPEIGRAIIRCLFENDETFAIAVMDTAIIDICDFLRGRSYLVRFAGLSETELIDCGWVKLREV